MKEILFVIDSLTCGGAEKSLITLLNNLDYTQYNVDLLMFKRGGDFEKFIPTEVNILNVPDYFSFLSGRSSINIINRIKYLTYRVKTSIKLRVNNKSKNHIHPEQVVYKSIRNILGSLDKKYDTAIAYSQGFPTYFVSEKVQANKKLAWINCEYVKTMYDKDLDNKFYNNIDKIVVVSDYIYNSMSNMKYNYKDKMIKILDIIDPKLINDMALREEAKELKNVNEFKILTVGRLMPVKGYDLAIKAACLLKKNNYKFKWFIVGEGSYRNYLEEFIKYNKLENEVVLLGSKSNPYPYMKECDLYVQPSRREGFGLTVMEAKILKNVIITTNFDTARELITNGNDGIIVGMNEISLYAAIKKMIDDKSYYDVIKDNVSKSLEYSTVDEVNKVYSEIS